MNNNKVIRGKPEYIYRKSIYLEMPPKTVIKRVVYDKDTNISTVYCKKPSLILECVCAVIILLCVCMNQLYLHHATNSIMYNSTSYYYDGGLYLNIYNDDKNNFDLGISLYDNDVCVYSDTLSPGQYLIRIDVDEFKPRYTLEFSYRTIIREHKDSVQIMVIRKGEK